MEKKGHVLVVPQSWQGHINPMLEFSRRLASKGVKVTFAITHYLLNTLNHLTSEPHGVTFVAISDGHDHGWTPMAHILQAYLDDLEYNGSQTLEDLIQAYAVTPHPVTCLVYDTLLPWAFDVATKHGLVTAPFFTQACAVNHVFFLVYCGKLCLPVSSFPVEVPGLPPLRVGDLPSFVGSPESYPTNLKWAVNQSSNLDKVDFVLVNSCYELEHEVITAMSREITTPVLTIGPTIPSLYLDNTIKNDKDYDLNLYQLDDNTRITHWLSTKPPKSVVYVSFGSMASLSNTQMEELTWGLKHSGFYFLWVVRASEVSKLPPGFVEETKDIGLVVSWCPQLEVLANEAVGCFFTHCGWNSVLEVLALGVPMIGMPQWVDQPTNGMLIQDVWKMGVRVKVDEQGFVMRHEIVDCLKQVMVGKTSEEMRENAEKWKDLIKNAFSKDRSSYKNVEEFVSKIQSSKV